MADLVFDIPLKQGIRFINTDTFETIYYQFNDRFETKIYMHKLE